MKGKPTRLSKPDKAAVEQPRMKLPVAGMDAVSAGALARRQIGKLRLHEARIDKLCIGALDIDKAG